MDNIKLNKLVFSDFFNKNYKINYCDIGASGGVIHPWNLLDKKNLKVIGFEPDYEAYLKLCNENDRYYNIGLWSSKTTKTYYVLEGGVSISSMYPPNYHINNMHLDKYNIGRIVKEEIFVECNTLDNVLIQEDIPDFIKIDTQGSEYEILKGGENLLKKHSPIVTAESWTEELYLGAPCMEDIIILMKSFGYQLFTTELAAARKFKNLRNIEDNSRHHLSGLELLFIKKFDQLSFESPEKFINFIALLELYAQRNYAIYILENSMFIDEDLKKTLLDILYKNATKEIQVYPRLR